MSTEFRLKRIQDEIDNNVNDVLMKWNAKKVFLNEPFVEDDAKDICSACLDVGEKRYLRYCFVNIDEAVYKCESRNCLFPFRNFKYKNYADRTIFQYERIDVVADEQKDFKSPTKVEADNMDNFNIKWLDCNSYDGEMDLDNILNSSSEEKTCDIKEIINDICNNVQIPSTVDCPQTNAISFQNEKSSKVPPPARRLSKCLKYIAHLSPQKAQKRPSPEMIETKLPTIQTKLPPIFKIPNSPVKSSPKKNVSNVLKKDRKVVKKKQKRKVETLMNEQHSLGLFEWLGVINNIEPTQLKQFEIATPVVKEDLDVSKQVEETSDLSNQSLPILIEINCNQSPGDVVNYDHSESYQLEVEIENDLNNLAIPLTSTQLGTEESNHSPVENLIVPVTPSVNEKVLSSTEQPLQINDVLPNELNASAVSNTFKGKGKKRIKVTKREMQQIQRKLERQQKLEEKAKRMKLNAQKKEMKPKNSSFRKYRTEQWLLQRKILRERKLKRKTSSEQMMVKVKPIRKNFNIEVEEVFLGFEPVEPFKPIPLKERQLIWCVRANKVR